MRTIVLNGSPKGRFSVTMHYVEWLTIKKPDHHFEIVDVAHKIKSIESDPEEFETILAMVCGADLIVFAFPLYYLLVHSNYKRFIELLFERSAAAAFTGKYAASLSTSINYYDHTAHNYIQGIAEDLGMSFIGAFSARMDDLSKADGRDKLSAFFDLSAATVVSRRRTGRASAPVTRTNFTYTNGPVSTPVDCRGKVVRIVTDATGGDVNLSNMTARLAQSFSPPAEIINLSDIDIKGACFGCVKCGLDNRCAWEGKDGYIDFYRNKIMNSDILFLAGTMRDRYLSSAWKRFFDRSFFLCHQPKLNFGQVGFLIAGPLTQVDNLREILTAYLESNEVNPLGFATDECQSSEDVDLLIGDFARKSIDAASAGYRQPKTFRAIGGIKIFRDECSRACGFRSVRTIATFANMATTIFRPVSSRPLR